MIKWSTFWIFLAGAAVGDAWSSRSIFPIGMTLFLLFIASEQHDSELRHEAELRENAEANRTMDRAKDKLSATISDIKDLRKPRKKAKES